MADCWRELIQQNGSNNSKHPKLSIPKKIAEELEQKELCSLDIEDSLPWNTNLPSESLSERFISWCNDVEKWWAIVDIYLAGRALGVELVEVIDE